jgi:hypothetical protein
MSDAAGKRGERVAAHGCGVPTSGFFASERLQRVAGIRVRRPDHPIKQADLPYGNQTATEMKKGRVWKAQPFDILARQG